MNKEPLCFDYNPPAGSNMTLIMDPISTLIIVATMEEQSDGKVYMTKIFLVTPNGVKVIFNGMGVELTGLPAAVKPTQNEDDGRVFYGDVSFLAQCLKSKPTR